MSRLPFSQKMYQFKATETFWKRFYALPPEDKERVREKYAIFRADSFDKRLGAHKINKLTARYQTVVYGLHISGDLLITFLLKGNTILTISLGTHDEYK